MTNNSSRFPMQAFPNGWYKVAYSDELKPGAVQNVRCFGQELVLFRTTAGIPHVLDAYCPHLGAHLGHGGTVEGDRLRCPFHGWCFSPAGTCEDIPYSKHKPPKVQLKTWQVQEVNGVVMVYYDADGGKATWDFPAIPEYEAAGWVAIKGRTCTVNSHPQEILENFVDAAHFFCLHSDVIAETNGLDLQIDGNALRYTMQAQNVLGFDAKKVKTTVASEYVNSLYGLGFAQTWYKSSEVVGVDILLNFFITPIDDNQVESSSLILIKKVFGSATLAKFFSKFMLEKFVERGLDQDKVVWENKRYVSEPLLCKEDDAVRRYRQWARQFYSPQANALQSEIFSEASASEASQLEKTLSYKARV